MGSIRRRADNRHVDTSVRLRREQGLRRYRGDSLFLCRAQDRPVAVLRNATASPSGDGFGASPEAYFCSMDSADGGDLGGASEQLDYRGGRFHEVYV